MSRLLLRVDHGSHLYGTAHAGSDRDYWEIYEAKRRARQSIADGQDVVRLGLSQFLDQCAKGVPQALEAMFAPSEHTYVDEIVGLRLAYRAGLAQVRRVYPRTMRHFREAGDAKRARHALRLEHDLEMLEVTGGRFDPTRWSRRT